MLLLLSFIFNRLKLSSNVITTLEFGAFNHLINIQKVLDFFYDDGDGDDYGDDDGDYLCRWTCLTILWSAIATSLGSSITGIIITFYPRIIKLLFQAIKFYPYLSSSSSGTLPEQRPAAQTPLKTKTFWYSFLHQFILHILKMSQKWNNDAGEEVDGKRDDLRAAQWSTTLQPWSPSPTFKITGWLNSLSNNLFK